MSAQHAKWLREAAEQIAKAGHNGWGNTCLDAAASIEALEAELAALRADAEIGQRWKRDSSLETWFPYTAEELVRLRAERDKLLGCRDELREIAKAISDPRIHNTMTIAECVKELQAQLAAERARADAAVAEAAEHKMFREESARRLKEVQADRDRLRAAGRSLLACPHIAERDTDPDWVDAETEAAVAEMRDALKEGGGVMDDLRLHAYYYSFAPTGQREVDLILHAVARAGKAFHHTSQWADDEMEGFYEHCEGDTCEQWIQNAANKAAAELATLRARMAELERDAKLYRQLKLLLKTYGVDIAFPNSDDNGATDEWVSVSECSLDAAIDKAMEGE